MSLETVVEDVRDEARARAEEIRAEADERADEIVAEAEDEAEEIRDEREAEVERQIDQERERERSSAKLAAKQRRLAARRDALESVREDAEAAIADIDGDRRRELTEGLLDAALAEIDADEGEVFGRAEDEQLLEELLADREGFSLGGTVDCLGGVVVESDASRIRVDNTFDSVLEEVWEDELRSISDRLFEEQ